jgi:outer membrane autotransporter protein
MAAAGTIDVAGTSGNTLSGSLTGSGTLSLINSAAFDNNYSLTRLTLSSNNNSAFTGSTQLGLPGPANATAGRINVSVTGTGTLGTSGNAVDIYNNSELDFDGANANAGNLKITTHVSTNSLGTNSGVTFANHASAGSATLTNEAEGSLIEFQATTTAANSTINNGSGARVYFEGDSSGGNATISNSGGRVYLQGQADLSGVRLANGAGGYVFINGADDGISIGELSGDGNVVLGKKTLTVGALGTSSTIGGVISDTGPGFLALNGLAYNDPVTDARGALVKTGAGTLTLTGNNTYTGGTTISAGTLQLGNGGTAGSIVGDVVDNGTLAFNRSNAVTFDGVVSGTGKVSQIGTGTTILTSNNTYTGGTTISAGTLKAGAANAFSGASAHTVAAGATLDTAGFSQSVASLKNAGTVSLLGTAPGSTLTVNGAYVGNNGVLNLGTVLGGSSSLSDRLVLNGPTASASGNTTIRVTNLGGLGAQTTGNGIELVSALNGATTTAQTTRDAFTLANGHVDAGAFEYRLYAADAQHAGENWYLRSETTLKPTDPAQPTVTPDASKPPASEDQQVPPAPQALQVPQVPPVTVPTYRAEVPLFAALPAQLRQSDLAMLGNLHRRVGDENAPATGDASGGRQAWARAVYTDLDIRQNGIAAAQSEGHVSGLQAGTDLLARGNWRAGLYVGQLDGGADVSGNARGTIGRVGSNDLQSRYLGGYATWMDGSGLYADAVLQGGSHRYTVRPDLNLGASGKADSTTASIETGKSFPVAEGWSIEPQAQIAYQHGRFDDTLISGAVVRQDADSGWIGRLGVRVKGDIATSAGRLQPYGRVNVYHATSGTDVATFAGPAASTSIASATGYTSTEVAAGATLALTPSTTLYGEVGQLFSSGGDARVKSSVQGSVGVRLSW